MKYYNLNKDTADEYKNPILLKINSKTYKMIKQIITIIRKHRELEKNIIKEIALTNNIDEYELSDLLAEHDFLCDAMEYGITDKTLVEISKKEYDKLKQF